MQNLENALVRVTHGFRELQKNLETIFRLNDKVLQLHHGLARLSEAGAWVAEHELGIHPAPERLRGAAASASVAAPALVDSTVSTTAAAKEGSGLSRQQKTVRRAALSRGASSHGVLSAASSRKRGRIDGAGAETPAERAKKTPSRYAGSIERLVSLLPPKYRQEDHRTRIVNIHKSLGEAGSAGLLLQDLVSISGAPTKLLANEYLVQMVRAGIAARESGKGIRYKLLPPFV